MPKQTKAVETPTENDDPKQRSKTISKADATTRTTTKLTKTSRKNPATQRTNYNLTGQKLMADIELAMKAMEAHQNWQDISFGDMEERTGLTRQRLLIIRPLVKAFIKEAAYT